ncbi:MAG TPA: DUF6582 domain-containing protein [Candidatus Acidoferrales bacterium]|nr:DUF6582 domain-containing protein [Candidatus Acidoferrales bacterium]
MARPKHDGELGSRARSNLDSRSFAFVEQRKEPLTDADHVRNAVARFDQVEGVSDADRDRAWRKIRAAARRFGVEIEARGWRQLTAGGRSR